MASKKPATRSVLPAGFVIRKFGFKHHELIRLRNVASGNECVGIYSTRGLAIKAASECVTTAKSLKRLVTESKS
jgi:hypothetical protein